MPAPVVRSQIGVLPSRLPVPRRLPSGLNTTGTTPRMVPVRVASVSPVVRSQTCSERPSYTQEENGVVFIYHGTGEVAV
ncbi:hypothetical protein [Streptomyces chartreusis]|uniref:hypothetical protein n=1 Tax=Streptomyces chartreusis TaxID=1969 RepID=UPI00380422F5